MESTQSMKPSLRLLEGAYLRFFLRRDEQLTISKLCCAFPESCWGVDSYEIYLGTRSIGVLFGCLDRQLVAQVDLVVSQSIRAIYFSARTPMFGRGCPIEVQS